MVTPKEVYIKRKRPFFIVACLLAIAVHLWGIFCLNEIGIDMRPIGLITPYSKKLGQAGINQWETRKKEQEKRTKELAQAFQKLKSTPVHLKDIEIPFDTLKDITTEKMSTDSLETVELNELAQGLTEKIEQKVDQSLFLQNSVGVVDTITHPLTSERLPSLDSLSLVFSGEEQANEQMVQATSRLFGEVLIEEGEKVQQDPGLTVGFLENASPEGTSLNNQSGVIVLEDPQNNGNQTFAALEQSKTAFKQENAFQEFSQQLAGETIVGKGSLVLQTLNLGEESGVEELVPLIKAGTVASSNDFYVDLHFTEATNTNGYIFRIAIYPRHGITFKRIKQNMFFLIDRSHSINRKRYLYAKDAIMEALKLMHPGDTFNILVFDQNVVSLASQNLAWNHENLKKARDFLVQQKHGGLFASTELYSSLDTIIPEAVAETEVNTAILLSDGDTFLRREQQRQMIAQWTLQNRGKVSLFSVASGGGNNIPLLEVITAFNKGFLLYSSQDIDTKKSLTQLIKSIRNPIGKDITATVVTKDSNQTVELYPSDSRLPDLYENLPYVLIGHTSEKKDFHIFLQGRYYDRWLDIKQKIIFSQAKNGKDQLESDLAIQEAFNLYEHYLHEGDYKFVQLAKEKLQPLDLPTAFE